MKLEELIKGIQQTDLLYLADSYIKDFQATILRTQLEGKSSLYVLLDRTAFHPKGGGQPSDTGFIHSPNFQVEVRKVMLMDRVVVHWGRLLEGEIREKRIIGEVRWDSRYLYMKRHTAGHLLDHCLTILTGKPVETTDSWLGDPCYVGYGGEVPPIDHLKEAEALENCMIANGGKVSIENISYEELLKRAPYAPNIYRLPSLKNYRIVTIEGRNPIPCAGTHLRDIKEIGHFSIKRMEKLASGFRVYYDVQ